MNVREAYDRLVALGMQPWEVPTSCRPDQELEDLLTMHALRWAQSESRVGIELFADGSGHFEVGEYTHKTEWSKKHRQPAIYAWQKTCMNGMLYSLVEALEAREHAARYS